MGNMWAKGELCLAPEFNEPCQHVSGSDSLIELGGAIHHGLGSFYLAAHLRALIADNTATALGFHAGLQL